MTSEEMSQKFLNSETVQIETVEDYNILVTYLNLNPQSSNIMRNVLITKDLDFDNKDITFYSNVAVNNITIDGGGHTLKNIVKTNVSNRYIFFAGYLSNSSIIKNITFSNCYIQNGSTNTLILFNNGCLENIKIEKCRFVANSSVIISETPNFISHFSSSATIISGENYTGIEMGSSKGDHIALVNNVIHSGSYANSSAVSILFRSAGSASVNFIYTRDKFKNFQTITGINGGNGGNAGVPRCFTSYSAVSSDDATTKYALNGSSVDFVSCYYDNTLIPDSGKLTNLGIPTEILQSIAEMTSRGWFVKAVE